MDIQKFLREAEERYQRQKGQRVPKKIPVRCGAYARSTGKPCVRKAMANGRCPNHGGLSTGPQTPLGRARALANLKQFRE